MKDYTQNKIAHIPNKIEFKNHTIKNQKIKQIREKEDKKAWKQTKS